MGPAREFGDAFSVVLLSGAAVFARIGEQVSGQVAGPETLEPLTWAMVQRAHALPAADLLTAQAALHAWSVAVHRRLAGVDVVLTLSLPGPPLPLGAIATDSGDLAERMRHAGAHAAFTPMANITGRPALTLPVDTDSAGLPLSVQLVGRPADEATLLSLGSQIERHLGVGGSP